MPDLHGPLPLPPLAAERVERVFLGWGSPCIPAAVSFLRQRYAAGSAWDMQRLLVVVPGGRAARRLLELLAEAASGAPGRRPLALAPPTIVTTGSLPEQLYSPPIRPVDELASLLARAQSLRSHRDRLCQIVPAPPQPNEWSAWTSLARDLHKVGVELAAEGLTPGAVANWCRQRPGEFCDAARWDALEALHQEYLQILGEQQLTDLHQARLEAVQSGATVGPRDVILLSTLELNRISRLLLARSRARVCALIHAPETEAEGYDDWGCLAPTAWQERRIEIPEAALKLVDRPRDQVQAVLRGLAELGETVRPDEVTVGLGDSELAGVLERGLELAGVPARRPTGRDVGLTPPAMLLRAVAEYLDEPRADRVAALVRHPDLESWLLRKLQSESGGPVDAGNTLTLLDRYIGEHLPHRLGSFWPTGTRDATSVATLRAIHEALRGLLSPLHEQRRLTDWPDPLARLLGEVFGGRDYRRGVPEDQSLIQSLEPIAAELKAMRELPLDQAGSPELNGAQAIGQLLEGVCDLTLPEEGMPGCVELLGWLELALDDAPVLFVTGVNEGRIPESVNADAFLPDGMRRELSLPDNRHRYARDAAIMTALLQSRKHVTLIAGRRSAGGEPLAPSRLLFACDERTLIARALAFYSDEAPGEAGPDIATLPAGTKSRFRVPRPKKLAQPVERLPVTAFRSYLACPYRFYLRHVLKLSGLSDDALEMDGGLFGNLLHEVLCEWGRSEWIAATDSDALGAYLEALLERMATGRFGSKRSAAVEIQLRQARRRLLAFARWQAGHASEGWRVIQVEADLEATLEIPEGAITIHGRIDRIDQHPNLGCLVLDYKTGESARHPEMVHRVGKGGEKAWIDLQLPLYRHLIAAAGIGDCRVSLGYVCLPRELGQTDLYAAEWSEAELETAAQTARAILKRIRSEEFWPPSEALQLYADDLAGICFDRCLDREGLVAR